jgi:hypothetical protein
MNTKKGDCHGEKQFKIIWFIALRLLDGQEKESIIEVVAREFEIDTTTLHE